MSEQHPPGGTDERPSAPPPPPGQYGQQPEQYGQQPGQDGRQPPPPPGGSSYGQQPYGQQPPYAAPAPAAGGPGRPGELMPRFFARLIDFVILGVVIWTVVMFVVLGMVMGASGGLMMGDTWASSAVGAVLSAALYLGYFALMESSQGRTIGKMALGLEVRGASGGHPTMAEALKRNAWTALGILAVIPWIGGLIGWLAQLAAAIYIAVTISNDTARRQGWHDRFAGGTTVVRTS